MPLPGKLKQAEYKAQHKSGGQAAEKQYTGALCRADPSGGRLYAEIPLGRQIKGRLGGMGKIYILL